MDGCEGRSAQPRAKPVHHRGGRRKAKCIGASRDLAKQVCRLEAALSLVDLALSDSGEKTKPEFGVERLVTGTRKFHPALWPLVT